MSFATPGLLALLVAIPVLVGLYVVAQRRRARAARAFASPALLASVAPSRPGWRRHVPVALALAALATMLVGIARPQTTVAQDVEQASVMLVTDRSGSMEATDVRPTRLRAAKASAERFLGDVPRTVRVGLVAFNQVPRVVQTPTTDRAQTRVAIRSLTAAGGTATGEAINTALRALRRAQRGVTTTGRVPAAIVLLSDGASTRGRDPIALARAAKQAGVRIYTVTLGTDAGAITVQEKGRTVRKAVPPDRPTLAAIARISGGRSFAARDANSLRLAYEQLGSKLGTRKVPREVTSAFAGGAVLLLAAAALLSIRWFARPI